MPSLASAETLDWGTRPATNIRTVGTTDTATFGTSNETTVITSGAVTGTFTAAAGPPATPTLAIEPTASANGTTGYINSVMDVTVGNETMFQTTTLQFNEPVYNVNVTVGDIDGGPTFSLTNGSGTFFFNDIIEFRGISPTNATVLPTSGTPVDTNKVLWTAATGRASARNFNVTDNTGDVTVNFSGPIKTLTIRHIAGANSNGTNTTNQFVYIESVTFTRTPRLTLRKTSVGGTGNFTFDVGNRYTATPQTGSWTTQTIANTVPTTVAGTQATGTVIPLLATATNTVVTETLPTNWVITAASCSTGAITRVGQTFTIPAAQVVAGANIVCDVTNAIAAPAMTLNKTSSVPSVSTAGTTITYTMAVQNSGNTMLTTINMSDPLGTVVCPSSGASSILSLAPGASESCTMTYAPDQTIFDSNGGGDGDIDNTATASTTYNAAPVSATGSRAVLLTIAPNWTILKERVSGTGNVNAGDTISYRYRVTNIGNVTINNVGVTDVHNGYGIDPVPGSESISNDVAPLGTSTDATANNGVWSFLRPGDTVQFTASYVVVQSDIDLLQ